MLDLKELEFLSSAGVRAMISGLKIAKKSRHTVKLASIPDHIAGILKTLGVMELIQVHPSVEEAIAGY